MEDIVMLRKPLVTESLEGGKGEATAWTLYKHNLMARGTISLGAVRRGLSGGRVWRAR